MQVCAAYRFRVMRLKPLNGTNLVNDSDGDTAVDFFDAFPEGPTEFTDTDGDGIGK